LKVGEPIENGDYYDTFLKNSDQFSHLQYCCGESSKKKVFSLGAGNPPREAERLSTFVDIQDVPVEIAISLLIHCRKSSKKRKSSHLLPEIVQEKKVFQL
jgi:hypothetical protein